jgi:mannitol/fructose-specific phosphotransferase system IIA component (Ntr-type)
VDFAALDQSPVFSIVLLLTPENNPDGHLQAMENIFRHLQDDRFRRWMRQAETKKDILDLLDDADQTSAAR